MLIAFAFLSGSIPFGAAIGAAKGINLKKAGSGNIGATNVMRTMGKWPAFLTLTGDVIKGALPVAAARYLGSAVAVQGVVGLAAIAGHIFSPFLKFKGGKGVATGIGVLLVYSPTVALITVFVWLTVVFVSRYSSLGAITSFLLLPFNVYIFDYSVEKVIISVIISSILILRHGSNIERLFKGTETKIGARGDR